MTYVISVGSIALASSNPFDDPIIDPNFLSTTFDRFAMNEVVRTVRGFLAAPAFNGFITTPYGATAAAVTDTQIDQLITDYSACPSLSRDAILFL